MLIYILYQFLSVFKNLNKSYCCNVYVSKHYQPLQYKRLLNLTFLNQCPYLACDHRLYLLIELMSEKFLKSNYCHSGIFCVY